jgi:predicted ATP-dependent protease
MRSLPATSLYRRCDPAQFTFSTTAELADLDRSEAPARPNEPDGPDRRAADNPGPAGPDGPEGPDGAIQIVGQERAMEAIRFGIGIRHQGYNLFALGPTGLGKHRMVRHIVHDRARGEPTPDDWCYVNNFDEPQKPRALRLPPGRGTPLRRDMERLIEELRVAIPAAFESEEYRARKQLLEKELEVRHAETFGAIQHRAKERGIALMRTPVGLALGPVIDGEILGPEAFEKLPEADRERITRDVNELQAELQAAIQAVPRWQREIREKDRALSREIISHAVAHLLDEVRKSYGDLPQVLSFLDAVAKDLADKVDDLVPGRSGGDEDGGDDDETPVGALPEDRVLDEDTLRGYRVNVLTDHGERKGAPVVYEDHPTHPNLIGRVEHLAQYGALLTDFNLIRPGALHRANGGYLIIDARKLLEQPLAWEELKRALRSRKVKIESIEQAMSLVSTVSLEPEPIPLDVKVVLLGEPLLYYALIEADPDFLSLFKVAADFAEDIERGPDTDLRYARLLGQVARREKLLPLRPCAVARVIEHAARLSGDSTRLSTHLRSLIDLLCEADYFSRGEGKDAVDAPAVQRAIDAQVRRADRIYGLMLEEICRGTVRIDTQGALVGQINGLTVQELGELAFGRPVRITARVRLGRGDVVDIERDVELGGPIHSKGVLILSGFLGARYAADTPLSLQASLVFEQSYTGVEGDSASSAELYALLSALADVPLRQDLAVTGSVDQLGQVQAIGGVNEKIEGFFDLCRLRGLTGGQGVLIPATNVPHLMLRRDVVSAVEAGRFHIYPILTIDQGIELLSGEPAELIHRRVKECLDRFSERARYFRVQP